MSVRTEGETTVSDPDTLVKFAAVAADLATSTGHPYHEIYESLVDALGCLAEAERRGSEKGWQGCVEWFAQCSPLNNRARIAGLTLEEAESANPYRSGADQ